MFDQQRLVLAALGTSCALAFAFYTLRRIRIAAAVKRCWPELGVEVRTSTIPNSGDGLFASIDFQAGATLGQYRGRVLSLLQAHQLEDRDYLMGGFGLNAHVDARFALNAPGRYVNDNNDESQLNARFEKDRDLRVATLIATRAIRRGEEIFASYGESYWRARGHSSGKPPR